MKKLKGGRAYFGPQFEGEQEAEDRKLGYKTTTPTLSDPLPPERLLPKGSATFYNLPPAGDQVFQPT